MLNTSHRNGMIAGAMTITSMLGGCASSSGSGAPVDKLSPPQESTRLVTPGVREAQYALSQVINTGAPIDLSGGVSLEEAWKMVHVYALRRTNISEDGLRDQLARGGHPYDSLHDAQQFADLALVMNRTNTESTPISDVSGYKVISRSPAETMNSVRESIAIARALSNVVLLRSSRSATNEARTLVKIAGIMEWDLALASRSSDAFTPSDVLNRLSEDAMIGDWIRVVAAARLAEVNPRVSELTAQFSPDSAKILRGDSSLAHGFATFNSVWPASFSAEQQAVWGATPLPDRVAAFTLFRSIPASAYRGSESVSQIEPSPEIQGIFNPVKR